MRDADTVILENIYTKDILKEESAPRQRGILLGLWDRLAGSKLDHPTSISRNNLIDIYKEVWKTLEDDWESNNAIKPQIVNLEYLADFLNRKYPEIDVKTIIDPLAHEYSPEGDFLEELDKQTTGDFIYDALADYYSSIGGFDQTPSDTLSQVENQEEEQETPKKEAPENRKDTRKSKSSKTEYFNAPKTRTSKEKKPSFWKNLKNKVKTDFNKSYSSAKSQIRNT